MVLNGTLLLCAVDNRCLQSLAGLTGGDLFSLHRQEMEQLLGHEEAARLQGQLTLQKKMTGVSYFPSLSLRIATCPRCSGSALKVLGSSV